MCSAELPKPAWLEHHSLHRFLVGHLVALLQGLGVGEFWLMLKTGADPRCKA
jgi:hypothetical protein